MKSSGVIDRIEGELAVIEFGQKLIDFPMSSLPEGAQEGDTVVFNMVLINPKGADTAPSQKPEVIDL
jgi:hypothetical protein